MYIAAPEAHIKKEREKARELRSSQWWKRKLNEGVCYHCEQKFAPSELNMDHLIPVGRGGHSDKNNVVPSCKPCNIAKKALTPAERLLSPENS